MATTPRGGPAQPDNGTQPTGLPHPGVPPERRRQRPTGRGTHRSEPRPPATRRARGWQGVESGRPRWTRSARGREVPGGVRAPTTLAREVGPADFLRTLRPPELASSPTQPPAVLNAGRSKLPAARGPSARSRPRRLPPPASRRRGAGSAEAAHEPDDEVPAPHQRSAQPTSHFRSATPGGRRAGKRPIGSRPRRLPTPGPRSRARSGVRVEGGEESPHRPPMPRPRGPRGEVGVDR